ncbi:hypothetical protein RhiirB3_394636 [Rhizophagus irregularis]|nr:hypothetical protein RhiirB3_394636 [Rhizophagus irregularis]
MYTETKPTNPTPNNNNNNNQNKNNSGCYVCRRTRHIVKNCRQRNNQQNNNNRNNNGRDLRNVDCYNCGRKGHIFKNCRSPSSNNNKSNNNGTNNGFQSNIQSFKLLNASLEGESANFRKSSNKNSAKRVNWKDLLEEIRPIEKPIQLLKRPIYVLNILYNNFRIYLSKQLQKDKTMYNLWQVEGGKVENRETSLQAVLKETKEETALDIKKDECIFYSTIQLLIVMYI